MTVRLHSSQAVECLFPLIAGVLVASLLSGCVLEVLKGAMPEQVLP